MKKPFGIQLVTLLMACAIVMDQTVAFTYKLPQSFPAQATAFQAGWVGIGSLVINLIEAAFVIAFWNGMNWVRWAVMIYSVYSIIELANVSGMWVLSQTMAVLYIYKAALGIYLLIYVNLPRTREWFSEQTRISRESSTVRSAKPQP